MSNDSNVSSSVEDKYNLILLRVGPSKIQVIKEIKESTRAGLVKAKTLAESTPSLILEGVEREEANILKSRLENCGASARVVSHTADEAAANYDQGLDALSIALERLDGFSKGFLVKREIKELPNILWEGELPEMLTSGLYNNGNGVLVATDRRLIFVDKGMFGSLKIEDFPYDKVSSIESKTEIIGGEITIFVSGNREQIKSVPKEQASVFADYLRNKVYATNDKVQIAGTTSADQDTLEHVAPTGSTIAFAAVADELEKLANLRDRGVLTDEEFNAQKARLLQ